MGSIDDYAFIPQQHHQQQEVILLVAKSRIEMSILLRKCSL
jgi:hypothetical protein